MPSSHDDPRIPDFEPGGTADVFVELHECFEGCVSEFHAGVGTLGPMPDNYEPGGGGFNPIGFGGYHDGYEEWMAHLVSCFACCGIEAMSTMIAMLQSRIDELWVIVGKVNGGAPCDIDDFICGRTKRRLWAAIDALEAMIALLRSLGDLVFEDCATHKSSLPDEDNISLSDIKLKFNKSIEEFEESEIRLFKSNYNAIIMSMSGLRVSYKTPKDMFNNMRRVVENVISFSDRANQTQKSQSPTNKVKGKLQVLTTKGTNRGRFVLKGSAGLIQYYKGDVVTFAGKTYSVLEDVKGKHPSNDSSFLLIEDKNSDTDGGIF